MKNFVRGLANQAKRGLSKNTKPRPAPKSNVRVRQKGEPLVHELVVVGTEKKYKPYEGIQPLKRVENVFGGMDPDHPEYTGDKLNKLKQEQLKYAERKEGNYVFHCVTHTGENKIKKANQMRKPGGYNRFVKNVKGGLNNRLANSGQRGSGYNRPRTAQSNPRGGSSSRANPSWNNFMNRVRASNSRQSGRK